MNKIVCSAYVKPGRHCKRSPKEETIFCWQHQDYIEEELKRIHLTTKYHIAVGKCNDKIKINKPMDVVTMNQII